MAESTSKRDVSFWQPWWGPVLVIVLILLGYYKVFLGYNFFIHEDWIAISSHTFGNKLSNGWRPDKGLGISNFYGDPGMWHPWSLFSFWERLFQSRIIAHASSVILMGTAAALSIYAFTRRFLHQINPLIAALIAPLVVFCFDQPAQQYARSFISVSIAMPLVMWLLYDYFQRPRWVHVFISAFLMWFTAFFGNLWAMTQLWSFAAVFSACYAYYFKTGAKTIATRFFFLYIVSGLMFILLGAWVFYSFLLDQSLIGYVREKPTVFPAITFFPDIKGLISYIAYFFPLDVLPITHELAAINLYSNWLNVGPVFMCVFLYFLSRKAKNFWEFAVKVLLSVFFIHGLLVFGKLLPGYTAIYSFLGSKTSKLLAMYDFVFSLQTLLIIMFVATADPKTIVVDNKLGRGLQKMIAAVTIAVYSMILVLALFSRIFPIQFLTMVDQTLPALLPSKAAGYSRELLTLMLSYNARRFQELVTPQLLGFFTVTIMTVGIFLRDGWLRRAAGLNKFILAAAILVNALLLSWALYPLTNKPWVWDNPQVKAQSFEPTDRFYFVRYFQWDKTPEGFRQKYMDVEGGHRQRLVGYLETPGVNISGFKSFNSRPEFNYMRRVFEQAGLEYERLYYGANFLYSPFLDMAAVKYYYSDGPMRDLPLHLEPYAQFGQLYVYKNLLAWPYYYLAGNLQEIGAMKNPQQGTAYLEKSDLFQLPDGAGSGDIQLTSMGYGKFKFAFNSPREEFLVLADAWHPLWKATVNGRPVLIAKANEVFKGVRLPAGKYDVVLEFDTAPYKPGIYISMIAWILFAIRFAVAVRDRRAIRFLEVKK